MEARDADIAKRFKAQIQSPGTEAALRRSIQELQHGEPNYQLISAQLAESTRQQLPQLKTAMAPLGALQTVSFKGVGPGGADIYEVKFEHATTEWRIALSSDGKTEGITFRMLACSRKSFDAHELVRGHGQVFFFRDGLKPLLAEHVTLGSESCRDREQQC